MCYFWYPGCEQYHVTAVRPQLMVYNSREWVISCDGYYSMVSMLYLLFRGQVMSCHDCYIFWDSWSLCHCITLVCEWYHVIAVIPRLMVYICAVPAFQLVGDIKYGCYSNIYGLWSIHALQLVSNIMWWLLFQDSWIMYHSCFAGGGLNHVMAAIPRFMMIYVPFLLVSLWVGCYDSCYFIWFMCHSCSLGCEWYHVMAIISRLVVYVLLSRK